VLAVERMRIEQRGRKNRRILFLRYVTLASVFLGMIAGLYMRGLGRKREGKY
jgi:hypothetical protein